MNYGFGYAGVGFAGGYWSGGSFYYNRSVANIGNTAIIGNVYNKTVVVNNTTNVSYNGGNGGLKAQPTAQELQAAHEHHISATNDQLAHQKLASENKSLRASVCKGKPPIAAVTRVADYSPKSTFAAKGATGFKPASLKPGNDGQHHFDSQHTARSNDGLGAKPFNANHGPNKNAIANLNAGSNNQLKQKGTNFVRPKGAPPRAAIVPKKPGPRPVPHQHKDDKHHD